MEAYKSPIELANNIAPSTYKGPDNYAFDTGRLTKKGRYEWGPDFQNKRLVRLSADDYYKLVANEVGLKWQDLQDQRRAVPNQISVEEMAKLMKQGEKFPTPWLHLNNKLGMIPHFQEGLHRMLAAKDVYGDKAKFPVWLGYEKGEEWRDIENGDIDSFIKNMNEKRRQNQIDYDNAEYEKEQAAKEEDKRLARLWFGLNGQADVTDEQLERYREESDRLFEEDED